MQFSFMMLYVFVVVVFFPMSKDLCIYLLRKFRFNHFKDTALLKIGYHLVLVVTDHCSFFSQAS